METSVVSSHGTLPESGAAPDMLDDLVNQHTQHLANLRYWRVLALGACGITCGTLLAVHVLLQRPLPAPLVQYVIRDAAGAFIAEGSPIPMSQYTPAEGQWVSMLHTYVLYLRERGRDEQALHRAWTWLKWHTCGKASALFHEYEALEKPFEQIGLKRREVLNLRIAKTDLPYHYSATWEETFLHGVQQAVKTSQTVVFRVARRPFEPGLWPSNPYGLCVAQFGGLTL